MIVKSTAKVQQKMHIRKQSEHFFEKIFQILAYVQKFY